jgi:hypothetical protein
MNTQTQTPTFAELVSEAQEQVARYPQYADAFDERHGWRLAVATKNVTTKMGLAFAKGETYLARLEDDPDDEFYGRTFGWSRSNGISTLVRDGDLRFASVTSL